MTDLPRRLLALALLSVGLCVFAAVAALLAWHFIASSGATLTLNPAFSLWLLFPGITLALILSALLYREQRRMAPFYTVLGLTAIRLLLILLLAGLFLQPALRWRSSRTTAGTLWVVVDQSPSLQTIDSQATPAERLHWADGMGLVSRPLRPDVFSAQIRVLADELDALTPATGGWGGDERAAVKTFAERMDAWNDKLKSFVDLVDSVHSTLDSASRGAGANTVNNLNNAFTTARQNTSSMRSAANLREALTTLRPDDIARYLRTANDALLPAIAATDAAFLRQTATPAWTAASARLAASSRQNLADGFLTDSDARATALLHDLAKQYTLRIASFSDKTQSAGTVDESSLHDTLRAALVPSGQATNIASALQFVAEQIPGDEAASIILVTDGRNNLGSDPTSPARNLAARNVHVYGLLIGSHELSPDAAVELVDFPDWIYAGDSIQPRALVRLDGLDGQSATVELRRGGQLLESRTIKASKPHDMIPFDFTDKPPESEKVLEYELRVSQMPGESNTQNNVASFRVAVKKDKLYALIIEDRPRWEYRYLAATLARRPGMKLQTILLAPATVAGVAPLAPVAASPDNPRTEAQLLPASLEEWQRFDVIVLGDVGPDVLTPQMQQFIASAVRDKGATLITIAGQRSMPEKFAASILADLLPVSLNPQYTPDQLARHIRAGFRPETSPTAGMSVLAQLGAEAGSNGLAWQNMPLWYWHSPFTDAKPAASVIWSISELAGGNRGGAGGGAGGGIGGAEGVPGAGQVRPEGGGREVFGALLDANRHALLSTISIGLGHSLYIASDQTWRLRQVGGLNLHDRFWGQVLNWAVGSDLPAGGKYVRFGANQPTYEQTQPVIITARILKDDLTPYTGLSFNAVARPVRGPQNMVQARFEPMESPGYYQATLSGLPIGDDEISLAGAEVERLLNTDPTVTLKTVLVKVYPSMNAERRNLNTDPAALEAIARAGGGFSVDGQYADMLFSRLPKIEHTEISIYQLGFFTDPAAMGTKVSHGLYLAIFALLITLEWALRKRAGLA